MIPSDMNAAEVLKLYREEYKGRPTNNFVFNGRLYTHTEVVTLLLNGTHSEKDVKTNVNIEQIPRHPKKGITIDFKYKDDDGWRDAYFEVSRHIEAPYRLKLKSLS